MPGMVKLAMIDREIDVASARSALYGQGGKMQAKKKKK